MSFLHQEIGQLLEEIAKVQKLGQFYPLEHPMVLRGLERLESYLRRLQPRVSRLDLVIQKSNFLFQQAQVPGKEEYLKTLAHELTRRFVRELHFELPVETRDLRALFLLLVRDPKVIKEAQGPEAFLAQNRAERIWVNAHRFELTQISEEEEPPAQEEEVEVVPQVVPDRVSRLREKLARASSLEELAPVLEEIVTLVRDIVKAKEDPYEPALLLEILYEEKTKRTSPEFQKVLGEAMLAVAHPPVVRKEIQRMEQARESQWLRHGHILVSLGAEVTPFLVQTLAETQSRRFRLRLLRAIKMVGKPAVRYLIKFLTDERWFLLRNVLLLLGDLGDTSLVPVIKPFLEHPERRVREAALDALGKLGGEEALALVQEFLEECEDAQECARAVERLASFPAPMVIPLLLRYIEEGGEIGKSALRVLVELDPPGVSEFLAGILKKRPLWIFRKKMAQLRPVAAELLCLKLPETWSLLKGYASDPDPEVRRWVAHAIEWLKRSQAVPA